MELHIQTCQFCGSKTVRNLLVRKGGEEDKVYVQCAQCASLVARYIIAHRGYYHHGKGFESYLRGLNRGGEVMSPKDLREAFEKVEEYCVQEFENIISQLELDADGSPTSNTHESLK